MSRTFPNSVILAIILAMLTGCASLSGQAGGHGHRDALREIVSECLDTTALQYCRVCPWPRADQSCPGHADCRDTTQVWAESDNYVAIRDIKMCGCPEGFVHGLALPRARITGEAAVALSQHGTVAPVTIHHRVDFAASMVDGRTVGEVVPKSASAKEVRDLWIYVQGRLSRLTRDAAMTPEFVPENFSVSGLSAADDRDSREADTPDSDAELFSAATAPPFPDKKTYNGPDRRTGFDRRHGPGEPPSGIANRRAQPFGRRSTDPSF